MEHTAHHAHMQIPLDELRGAQGALRRRFPEAIIEQRWSLGSYLKTTASCKLYDYKNHVWTDFDGRVTANVYDP